MRSAIVAAFAAGAIAVPYHAHMHKRDVVTESDVDVVYVTDVVTVTAGGEQPTVQAAAATSAGGYSAWPWHHWSKQSSEAAPTSEAPAPSTYAAPTSTSVYVAPSSSSSSEYVAPTTYAASSSSSEAAPATTAAPTSAAAAKPTTYSQTVVYHHNLHRKNHSAPAVEWDQGLADTAATIAQSCVYAHNVDCNGGGYGQNIAAGVEANNISAVITDLFYNGEVGWYDGLYGQEQPSMTNFESWGHFSQIVWKGTTKVGCATQDCSAQGLANTGSDVSPYFTVCNYESPGNYANEYGANVLAPLGYPTAQWNAGL